MNDIVFCSMAFGDNRYLEQQERLQESILSIYPDANLIFHTNEYPKNSKTHLESYYGFKVHLVKECLEAGFKKIIFFDPACILVDKVDYWFGMVKDYGVVAAKDDNLLYRFCGTAAYEYFGTTRTRSMLDKQHLVGGSLYVFDFNLELCNCIFNKWYQSEIDGMFGGSGSSATLDFNSHRNDESCMALSLYSCGSEPTPYDIARYCNGEHSIVQKKHFK